MTQDLLGFTVALAVGFIAIWPARRIAISYRVLDWPKPNSHKAHRRPIPYLGGVAIYCGFVAGTLFVDQGALPQVALAGLVAALGVFDDIAYAAVATKVVVQLAVAAAAVGLGFTWQITDSAALNYGVTVLWLVGVTNAFNLIDNMDGLAATVAATSLAALLLLTHGASPLAPGMVGALVAFLWVNRPEARMYMGDGGSLQVGFVVALTAIGAANSARGLHSLVLLAGPVAPALLDTSLVIVSRLIAGRPVQLGGRDHISHRLLQLGWSRPAVLAAAFAATVMGSAAAYLAGLYPLPLAWLAVPLVAVFAVAWLRLLRVDPYTPAVFVQPEAASA